MVNDTENNAVETVLTELTDMSMADLIAERGFEIVVLRDNRESSNKFLGSDKPKLGSVNFKGEPRRGATNSNGI